MLAISAFTVFMLVSLVTADSDSLAAQTNSTNYEPVVASCVVNQSTVTPTENSNVTITVRFNVSDNNGPADLNNSLAKVEFDDNRTEFLVLYNGTFNASGCDTTDPNATTRQYTCGVQFEYWYRHQMNYTVRCYGGDKNDSLRVTKDTTNALEFAKLVASTVDGTTVSFGTITSSNYGTNVTDTNSPINITNTGNAALTTISVTGANLTAAGRAGINVGQFYSDDDSTANDAQQLTTSSQQITGASVPTEDETTGSAHDSIWAFFVVPSILESGSYSGTWTLTEAE